MSGTWNPRHVRQTKLAKADRVEEGIATREATVGPRAVGDIAAKGDEKVVYCSKLLRCANVKRYRTRVESKCP